MLRVVRVLAAVAVSVPLIIGGATSAQAAQWNSISGTVLSGGAWYKSASVRTVTSGGSTIQLTLTQIPTKGIQWHLVNAKTGNVFSSNKTWSATGSQNLASGVIVGTLFQNEFRQNSSCRSLCGSYNFAGQEWY